MKIYILSEYDVFEPVGYYATKELAREGAKELYHLFLSVEDVDITFDEFWDQNCVLEEADLVTRARKSTPDPVTSSYIAYVMEK